MGDEKGNPVVGEGLYHTLWDTQQVEGKGSDTKLLQEISRLKAENAWLRGRERRAKYFTASSARASRRRQADPTLFVDPESTADLGALMAKIGSDAVCNAYQPFLESSPENTAELGEALSKLRSKQNVQSMPS